MRADACRARQRVQTVHNRRSRSDQNGTGKAKRNAPDRIVSAECAHVGGQRTVITSQSLFLRDADALLCTMGSEGGHPRLGGGPERGLRGDLRGPVTGE